MNVTETVRAGSERHGELVAAGYRVVGESWGARLELTTEVIDRCAACIAHVESLGFVVFEIDASLMPQIVELEQRVVGDYPVTPATAHDAPSERDLEGLRAAGVRFFGASHGGSLMAVSAMGAADGRAETEFTSVHPRYRRHGLAVAVKAASILAFAADGWQVFGTGGAALNEGSLRMNKALGYDIIERWVSLEA